MNHRIAKIYARIAAPVAALLLAGGCASPRHAIYQYDNGDDYLCEGLRRIVSPDGLIGFADDKGRVAIAPQFAFAFPFEHGLARATMSGREVSEGEHSRWVSDDWFCIDHSGKRVGGRYAALQARLQALADEQDARVGIAVIVDGRDTVAVCGSCPFPMMSVSKFPLALAVAEWMGARGMSMADSVGFGAEALRPDTYSPMLKKHGPGLRALPLGELLEWTLAESDNNSADILLDMIGGVEKASALLRRVGMAEAITIGASEADMHRDQGLCALNSATPLAMAELFDAFRVQMRRRTPALSQIAYMLEHCRTGLDRLAAPIDDPGAVIGHKTGTGFDTPGGGISALNDCGYVVLPDGTAYSIAVFVADSKAGAEPAARFIAQVSDIVYKTLKYNR